MGSLHVQTVRVERQILRIKSNATHLLRKIDPTILPNDSIALCKNVHFRSRSTNRLKLGYTQLAHKQRNHNWVIDWIQYINIGEQMIPKWLRFTDNSLSGGCFKHLFVVDDADVALKSVVVA